MTSIQKINGIYFKRDDLFEIAGVRGGKVRTCWELAKTRDILITAGSRSSPQVNIVAHIAKETGKRCRIHTPMGKLSPEVQMAVDLGAELFQHKAGYNSVIVARAKEDAKQHGVKEIPFGMECEEAVNFNAQEFADSWEDLLLEKIKRIIVPVGSGMSLCGIAKGMEMVGCEVPLVGIRVGSDPKDRFKRWLPPFKDMGIEILTSKYDYHEEYPNANFLGIKLDPIYEAKMIPYIKEGDLIWLVGIRKTAI